MMSPTPHRLVLASVSCLLACGGSQKPTNGGDAPAAGAQKSVASSCGTSGRTPNVRTADVDGDGKFDVFKYYEQMDDPERPGEKKMGLTRQDIDLNWDGRLDLCRYFGPDGTVQKEELDLDFDGNIDETKTYEAGVITLSERDRNNDGRPDIIRRYKAGKLVQKDTDTNGDGKVDRWEYFSGRSLDRVGIDLDHDGKVDRWAKSGEAAEASGGAPPGEGAAPTPDAEEEDSASPE